MPHSLRLNISLNWSLSLSSGRTATIGSRALYQIIFRRSLLQKNNCILKLLGAAGTLIAIIISGTAVGETITVHRLAAAPVLDGHGADWSAVPGTVIALHKSKLDGSAATESILIKGGVHGEYVCFYLEWQDTSQDLLHKPWQWDSLKQKYVTGPQREDRLALQFATGGDYSTDWLSGNEFTADMWHWKATRSNPLGLAHDKSTTISGQKSTHAYKGISRHGIPLYIARPSDSGDQLYRRKRYRKFIADSMPKYVLTEAPSGSVADIEARGVWTDGKWHLELRRKLNTGNPDDVVFTLGETTVGGLAVFDHSENDDHAVSDNLTFQF